MRDLTFICGILTVLGTFLICKDSLVKSANTSTDTAKPNVSSPRRAGIAQDDFWLSEASYKSAVVMLLSVWEAKCRDLKLLYQKTLQLDEYTRDSLRQVLLTFLPRRRRFFLRATESLEVSFVTLEDGRISRDDVDDEIEKVIEDLARSNLKRDHLHHSSITNRSRSKQPDLKVPSMSNNNDGADILHGGIFKSKLVQDMKVFEFRVRQWSPWKLALGVFTVGNYLHLFDVNDDSMEVNLGNATVEEAISRVKSITPDVTFVLSNSNCRLDSSGSFVEISTETNRAIRKMFQRKLCIRMSTFAETSVLMTNLEEIRIEAAASLERQRIEAAASLERRRIEAAANLERRRIESAERSKKPKKALSLAREESESVQAFV
jgi:hypothetical protein